MYVCVRFQEMSLVFEQLFRLFLFQIDFDV